MQDLALIEKKGSRGRSLAATLGYWCGFGSSPGSEESGADRDTRFLILASDSKPSSEVPIFRIVSGKGW